VFKPERWRSVMRPAERKFDFRRSPRSTVKKGNTKMAIVFDQFKFYNENGIPAHISLEAPIGTTILDLDVNPQSYAAVPAFSVQNIASLRLTVQADPADHSPDIETIDLGNASPYPVYLTAFAARSAIGSIEGEVSLAFSR
jgi:hypothetical protein